MSCFGGSIGSSSSNCGRANERVVAHIPYTNMPNTTNITLPHLSLSLKNRMENIGLLEGDFDPSILGKLKEDENESKSGSDNFEGASGDDQDAVAAGDNDEKRPRRKKYHRHTPQQIQELEAFFKECPHPDEKQRLDLSRRLSLETKQVKFWFQNRRTQLKTQMERHENLILRQENDRLRLENIAIKDAMRNPMCNNCGGAALMGDISYEENNLRIENARLKDELSRICSLADKFLGRSISSLVSTIPPPGPSSSSELAVGSNGFGGLNSIGSSATLPIGIDYRDGIPGSSPMVPLTRQITSLPCIDMQLERSILLELALTAMDELVKKAQIDNPLWIRSLDGGKEILNQEEYMRTFPPCIGMKPGNFVSEATRASSAVNINSLALVEMLMDVNRWVEMFPCLIARASTTDVISPGMNGTRNGALQLMFAELQVLSPLVPSRQVRFLRFCKHHAEGVWAVVDVSIDTIQDGSNGQTFFYCRRLPSGFVVQDMPNGFSKVIWVEHAEYDESAIHPLYRQVIGSGIGFGAQRWIATLQSQCECLAILMSSAISAEDNTRLSQAISSAGKRSMFKLTQRMIDNFCAEVCASSVHKWEKLEAVNIGEDVRVMTRKSLDDPGDPPGVLLGAATSVWMPITMQRLFDFLRDERMRSEWDILSNGGLMQEMVNIAKGQNDGNSVSLLRSNTMDVNENSMIILQETRTDPSGSLVVYSPVDLQAMRLVANGEDSTYVALLPSGFAIVPDGPVGYGGPNNCNNAISVRGGGGSLLTVGFQILVSSLPSAKLTVESIETVKNLISCTIERIKSGLKCT